MSTSSPESGSSESADDTEPPNKPLEPTGRRGHWSVVHKGKFYSYGGYAGQVSELLAQHLDVFDFGKCEWSVVKTEGDCPRTLSGACSALVGDSLYMFGGWYRGLRNADVHELSLVDLRWKLLTLRDGEQVKGCPLRKDKAGMVDYGDEMLCITGGYGYAEQYSPIQKGSSYHWILIPTSKLVGPMNFIFFILNLVSMVCDDV